MTNEQNNIESELDAALAALNQESLPTGTLPDQNLMAEQTAVEEQGGMLAPASAGSPTLEALDESRRPKAGTVCEGCPNSVWFASPAEVKCYCRVMFLITWSSKEPNQITHCDGEFLGQA